MKKNRVLSQESFEALLAWLAPSRDLSGQEYEDIRQRLIRIFGCRGCNESEDLADETINRVANKVVEIRETYSGEPALYFYAVANKIYMEYRRRKPPVVPPKVLTDSSELEEHFLCLEKCLDTLARDNRELVIQYYQDEK